MRKRESYNGRCVSRNRIFRKNKRKGRKNEGIIDPDKVYTGIINSLNEKGFGFINEDKTNESVFFHQSQLNGEVKKYNKVNYKKESSEKGFRAININKV